MKNSARPKSSKLVVVASVCALWVMVPASLNPEISYRKTDGKAMVLDIQSNLKSKEGLDNLWLPIDDRTGPGKLPTPLFISTIVRFVPPKESEKPHLNFRQYIYSKPLVDCWVDNKPEHKSLVGPYSSEKVRKQVEKEYAGLKTLKPNSHLKLHSDFMVIQVNGETRVYRLDAIPANLKTIYEREKKNLPASK
jgi:hypothetical protein